MARYLLSLKHYPVNVTLMDEEGRTALHAACKRSDAPFVKLLIETMQSNNAITSGGANSNASNSHTNSQNSTATSRPITTTTQAQGQTATPQLDLNLKCNKSGWTAFHYAASQGDIASVRLLMEAGMHNT